jgi:hypothetical protein
LPARARAHRDAISSLARACARPAGGLVEIDMKALLTGSESSPGFIFTANG